MFVKNLKAKNVGILKDVDIEFQKGFNVFAGDVGQGKSTITKPLMFGTINYVENTIKELVRWGEETLKFEFEFTHDKDYKIEIEAGKATNRKLTIDGHDESTNTNAVNRLSHTFDPALTKAAMISLQSDSTDLVNASDTERRERFKKIYDLDFSKEVKEVELIRKETEEQLAEIKNKILILSNKTYAIKELKKTNLSESEKKAFELELEKLQAEKSNFELRIKHMQEKQKQLEELQFELKTQKKELENYPIIIADYQDKIKDTFEEDSLQKRELQSIKESAEKEKIKVQEKITELEQTIGGIRLPRIARWDNSVLEEKQKEYWGLKSDLKSLSESLRICKQGSCSVCGQDISESHIQSIETQINEIENRISEISNSVEKLEKSKLDYEKSVKEKEELENDLKTLKYELEKNQSYLESLDSLTELKLSKVETIIESIQTKRKHLIEQQEKEELNQSKAMKEVEALEKKIAELEPTIEKIDFDSTAIDSRISDIRYDLNIYNEITVYNLNAIEENKEIEKQKVLDQAELLNLQTESNTVQGQIDSIKYGETLLKKDFPNYILSSMIKEVEYGMNEFLQEVYGGRYTVTLEDKKDGITLLYGPQRASVKNASGGEKDLFNIGLKFAFSKIAGLRALWLDEIDKFLSTEQAEKVYTFLNTKYNNNELDQIFVVSHNDEIKSMLENIFSAKVFILDEGSVI